MLSVFPELLDYSQVAVVFLRVSTGFFFLLFGIRLTQVAWSVRDKGFTVRAIGILYGTAKLITGTLLAIGLFTQVAAIAGAVLSFLTLSQGFPSTTNKSGQQVQLLLLIMCVSILFLGPGIFAIDWPL